MTLIEALRRGPVKQPGLARLLGVSERDVRSMVQQARVEGYPIASGPDGFSLAATSEELALSNRRLRHRLKEQYRTLRAQQIAERRMRVQESKPLAFFTDFLQ